MAIAYKNIMFKAWSPRKLIQFLDLVPSVVEIPQEHYLSHTVSYVNMNMLFIDDVLIARVSIKHDHISFPTIVCHGIFNEDSA